LDHKNECPTCKQETQKTDLQRYLFQKPTIKEILFNKEFKKILLEKIEFAQEYHHENELIQALANTVKKLYQK